MMNPALDKFDETIADLDKFEGIRYPEPIIRKGMTLEVGIVRNPAPMRHTEPRYQLILEELDELVQVVFQISKVNPDFFTRGLTKSDALRYLNELKRTPIGATMTDEPDNPLYQDMKCEILITRYKEQAGNLRDLNQYDFRLLGGFLTIQLVLAGWFATHQNSISVAVGIFVIDLVLLAVCIKIMDANRRRRDEIRDTIININEAFGLYTSGIYLPDRAINPPPKKRLVLSGWHLVAVWVF